MNIEPAGPLDLPAIRWLLGFDGLPSDDLTEQSLQHFLVLRDDGQVNGAVGLELYGDVTQFSALRPSTAVLMVTP